MAVGLNQFGLTLLDPRVERPAYDRSQLRTGIVHLGAGGFHQAHEVLYLDRLMAEGEAFDFAVTGVGVLPEDRKIVDVLNEQEGLYTLVLKYPDGRWEPRVLGSIRTMLFAPDDPEAVLTLMASPQVRIVSLTVTGCSYLLDQATGELDTSDEGIQHDLGEDATPRTAVGLIVEAIRRRHDAGLEPFTVMSCDNLPSNGDVARHMLTAYAELKDGGLAEYMRQHVAFPNSMGEQIAPATTAEDMKELAGTFGVVDGCPVVTEPFAPWVLEDHFPAGRPPFEDAGVQMVDDLEP